MLLRRTRQAVRNAAMVVAALAVLGAQGCVSAVRDAPGGGAAVEARMTGQAGQLYLFQYARGPAWREGVPMRAQGLGPHAAYMQQLQAEGRLFAGGGYGSDDGGMAIVTAASLEEARAMLAADPAIQTGVFVAELREWRVRFRTEAPLPD